MGPLCCGPTGNCPSCPCSKTTLYSYPLSDTANFAEKQHVLLFCLWFYLAEAPTPHDLPHTWPRPPHDLPHSWRAAKHYTTEEVYLNLSTIHDLLTKYGYIYYKNRTLSITLYIYTLFEGWGTCRVVNYLEFLFSVNEPLIWTFQYIQIFMFISS